MNKVVREMTLREAFDSGNFEVLERMFGRHERLYRDYEARCQAQGYEQIAKYKRQIEEKEETIQSLLKCIRILGN
jgi:prephenate dehydrogenase